MPSPSNKLLLDKAVQLRTICFIKRNICVIIFTFSKAILNCSTPAPTPDPTLSKADERTATETFRFGGLRRETTLDEIESYFNRFGQVTDCAIEADSYGRRLSTFTVTSSSPNVTAWLSGTLIHIVGASRCTKCKRTS